MAAVALGNPILVIEQEEAASIAKAAGRVARHYNLKASEVATDWANLVIALVTVYGTRVMAMRNIAAMQEPNPAPANVVSFAGS